MKNLSIEEQERAAIMEYAGNIKREDAEKLAVFQRFEPPYPWPIKCQCEACVAAARATVLGDA